MHEAGAPRSLPLSAPQPGHISPGNSRHQDAQRMVVISCRIRYTHVVLDRWSCENTAHVSSRMNADVQVPSPRDQRASGVIRWKETHL